MLLSKDSAHSLVNDLETIKVSIFTWLKAIHTSVVKEERAKGKRNYLPLPFPTTATKLSWMAYER